MGSKPAIKKLLLFLLLILLFLTGCSKNNPVSKDTRVGIIAYKGISPEKVNMLKKSNYWLLWG